MKNRREEGEKESGAGEVRVLCEDTLDFSIRGYRIPVGKNLKSGLVKLILGKRCGSISRI